MAKYSNTIEYRLKTDVDLSGINKLQASLAKVQTTIQSLQFKSGGISNASLGYDKILADVRSIQNAFSKSYNLKIGGTDMARLSTELSQAKINLKTLYSDFSRIGVVGTQSFNRIVGELGHVNTALRKSSNLADKFVNTFSNTLRWGVAASILEEMRNSVMHAVEYVKELDTSLNNIRIISGQSADEMRRFAQEANEAARTLGKTTTDFTEAALIFIQQGYNMTKSSQLAGLTLQTANVTGQSTDTVSEQLTALVNGYQLQGASIEYVERQVDKLAKVAAVGAADLEELATGFSKVSAVANTLGVSVEQLTAQLSTIISVTREAPETVGNSLKTIYSRLGDLKLGETLEDGVTLGQISSNMDKIGVAVLDATGNMRNLGTIIEDLMAKWQSLTTAQKQGAAVSLAGRWQYTRFMALMENSEMYYDQLREAEESAGTLDEQQLIYMDSLNAKIDKLKTSGEKIINTLFNPDDVKPMIDSVADLADNFANLLDDIGGLEPVLLGIGAAFTKVFSKQAAAAMTNFISNMQSKQLAKMYNENTAVAMLEQLGMNPGLQGTASQALVQMAMTNGQYANFMTSDQIAASNQMMKSAVEEGNKLAATFDNVSERANQMEIKIKDALIASIGQVVPVFEEMEDGTRRVSSALATLIQEAHGAGEALFATGKAGKTSGGGTMHLLSELEEYTRIYDKKTGKSSIRNNISKATVAQLSDRLSEFLGSESGMQLTDKTRKQITEYTAALDKLSGSTKKGTEFADEFRKVLQGLTDTLAGVVKTGEKQIDMLLALTEEYNEASAAVKRFASDQMELVTLQAFEMRLQALGTSVMNLVSAFSMLAMNIMMVKELGRIWTDDDTDLFDKIGNSIFFIGMAIPGILTASQALGNLSETIKTNRKNKEKLNEAIAAGAVETKKDTAAEIANQNAVKKNAAATGVATSKKNASNIATKNNTRSLNIHTGALVVDTAETNVNKNATIAAAFATGGFGAALDLLAKKLGVVGAMLGGGPGILLAIGVAAFSAFGIISEGMKQVDEDTKEKMQELKEQSDAIVNNFINMEAAHSTFQPLYQAFLETGEVTEDLKEAMVDYGKTLGVVIEQEDIRADNLKAINSALATQRIADARLALEAARDAAGIGGTENGEALPNGNVVEEPQKTASVSAISPTNAVSTWINGNNRFQQYIESGIISITADMQQPDNPDSISVPHNITMTLHIGDEEKILDISSPTAIDLSYMLLQQYDQLAQFEENQKEYDRLQTEIDTLYGSRATLFDESLELDKAVERAEAQERVIRSEASSYYEDIVRPLYSAYTAARAQKNAAEYALSELPLPEEDESFLQASNSLANNLVEAISNLQTANDEVQRLTDIATQDFTDYQDARASFSDLTYEYLYGSEKHISETEKDLRQTLQENPPDVSDEISVLQQDFIDVLLESVSDSLFEAASGAKRPIKKDIGDLDLYLALLLAQTGDVTMSLGLDDVPRFVVRNNITKEQQLFAIQTLIEQAGFTVDSDNEPVISDYGQSSVITFTIKNNRGSAVGMGDFAATFGDDWQPRTGEEEPDNYHIEDALLSNRYGFDSVEDLRSRIFELYSNIFRKTFEENPSVYVASNEAAQLISETFIGISNDIETAVSRRTEELIAAGLSEERSLIEHEYNDARGAVEDAYGTYIQSSADVATATEAMATASSDVSDAMSDYVNAAMQRANFIASNVEDVIAINQAQQEVEKATQNFVEAEAEYREAYSQYLEYGAEIQELNLGELRGRRTEVKNELNNLDESIQGLMAQQGSIQLPTDDEKEKTQSSIDILETILARSNMSQLYEDIAETLEFSEDDFSISGNGTFSINTKSIFKQTRFWLETRTKITEYKQELQTFLNNPIVMQDEEMKKYIQSLIESYDQQLEALPSANELREIQSAQISYFEQIFSSAAIIASNAKDVGTYIDMIEQTFDEDETYIWESYYSEAQRVNRLASAVVSNGLEGITDSADAAVRIIKSLEGETREKYRGIIEETFSKTYDLTEAGTYRDLYYKLYDWQEAIDGLGVSIEDVIKNIYENYEDQADYIIQAMLDDANFIWEVADELQATGDSNGILVSDYAKTIIKNAEALHKRQEAIKSAIEIRRSKNPLGAAFDEEAVTKEITEAFELIDQKAEEYSFPEWRVDEIRKAIAEDPTLSVSSLLTAYITNMGTMYLSANKTIRDAMDKVFANKSFDSYMAKNRIEKARWLAQGDQALFGDILEWYAGLSEDMAAQIIDIEQDVIIDKGKRGREAFKAMQAITNKDIIDLYGDADLYFKTEETKRALRIQANAELDFSKLEQYLKDTVGNYTELNDILVALFDSVDKNRLSSMSADDILYAYLENQLLATNEDMRELFGSSIFGSKINGGVIGPELYSQIIQGYRLAVENGTTDEYIRELPAIVNGLLNFFGDDIEDQAKILANTDSLEQTVTLVLAAIQEGYSREQLADATVTRNVLDTDGTTPYFIQAKSALETWASREGTRQEKAEGKQRSFTASSAVSIAQQYGIDNLDFIKQAYQTTSDEAQFEARMRSFVKSQASEQAQRLIAGNSQLAELYYTTYQSFLKKGFDQATSNVATDAFITTVSEANVSWLPDIIDKVAEIAGTSIESFRGLNRFLVENADNIPSADIFLSFSDRVTSWEDYDAVAESWAAYSNIMSSLQERYSDLSPELIDAAYGFVSIYDLFNPDAKEGDKGSDMLEKIIIQLKEMSYTTEEAEVILSSLISSATGDFSVDGVEKLTEAFEALKDSEVDAAAIGIAIKIRPILDTDDSEIYAGQIESLALEIQNYLTSRGIEVSNTAAAHILSNVNTADFYDATGQLKEGNELQSAFEAQEWQTIMPEFMRLEELDARLTSAGHTVYGIGNWYDKAVQFNSIIEASGQTIWSMYDATMSEGEAWYKILEVLGLVEDKLQGLGLSTADQYTLAAAIGRQAETQISLDKAKAEEKGVEFKPTDAYYAARYGEAYDFYASRIAATGSRMTSAQKTALVTDITYDKTIDAFLAAAKRQGSNLTYEAAVHGLGISSTLEGEELAEAQVAAGEQWDRLSFSIMGLDSSVQEKLQPAATALAETLGGTKGAFDDATAEILKVAAMMAILPPAMQSALAPLLDSSRQHGYDTLMSILEQGYDYTSLEAAAGYVDVGQYLDTEEDMQRLQSDLAAVVSGYEQVIGAAATQTFSRATREAMYDAAMTSAQREYGLAVYRNGGSTEGIDYDDFIEQAISNVIAASGRLSGSGYSKADQDSIASAFFDNYSGVDAIGDFSKFVGLGIDKRLVAKIVENIDFKDANWPKKAQEINESLLRAMQGVPKEHWAEVLEAVDISTPEKWNEQITKALESIDGAVKVRFEVDKEEMSTALGVESMIEAIKKAYNTDEVVAQGGFTAKELAELVDKYGQDVLPLFEKEGEVYKMRADAADIYAASLKDIEANLDQLLGTSADLSAQQDYMRDWFLAYGHDSEFSSYVSTLAQQLNILSESPQKAVEVMDELSSQYTKLFSEIANGWDETKQSFDDYTASIPAALDALSMFTDGMYQTMSLLDQQLQTHRISLADYGRAVMQMRDSVTELSQTSISSARTPLSEEPGPKNISTRLLQAEPNISMDESYATSPTKLEDVADSYDAVASVVSKTRKELDTLQKTSKKVDTELDKMDNNVSDAADSFSELKDEVGTTTESFQDFSGVSKDTLETAIDAAQYIEDHYTTLQQMFNDDWSIKNPIEDWSEEMSTTFDGLYAQMVSLAKSGPDVLSRMAADIMSEYGTSYEETVAFLRGNYDAFSGNLVSAQEKAKIVGQQTGQEAQANILMAAKGITGIIQGVVNMVASINTGIEATPEEGEKTPVGHITVEGENIDASNMPNGTIYASGFRLNMHGIGGADSYAAGNEAAVKTLNSQNMVYDEDGTQRGAPRGQVHSVKALTGWGEGQGYWYDAENDMYHQSYYDSVTGKITEAAISGFEYWTAYTEKSATDFLKGVYNLGNLGNFAPAAGSNDTVAPTSDGKGGGGGGGDGGKGYEPKHKDFEPEDPDLYEYINAQLEEIEATLEGIAQEEDRLTGNKLAKNINEQINLTKKQIDLEKQKLGVMRDELKMVNERIQSEGLGERSVWSDKLNQEVTWQGLTDAEGNVITVKYDDTGLISNYREIFDAFEVQRKAFTDLYNADQTEEGQEYYTALLEALKKSEEEWKKYHQRNQELVADIIGQTNSIEEYINKIEDLQIKMYKTAIDDIDKFNDIVNKEIEFKYKFVGFGPDDPFTAGAQAYDKLMTYVDDQAAKVSWASYWQPLIDGANDAIAEAEKNGDEAALKRAKSLKQQYLDLSTQQVPLEIDEAGPQGRVAYALARVVDMTNQMEIQKQIAAKNDEIEKAQEAEDNERVAQLQEEKLDLLTLSHFGENSAEAREQAQAAYDNLIKTMDDLGTSFEDLQKSIENTSKWLYDTVDGQVKSLEGVNDELEHLKTLNEMMFGEEDYDTQLAINKAQMDNIQAQYDLGQAKLDALYKERDSLEEFITVNGVKVRNPEWTKKNNEILSEESNQRKLQEDMLQKVQEMRDIMAKQSMQKFMGNLGLTITDGNGNTISTNNLDLAQEQWELLKKKEELTLDPIQSASEIQKLQLKYQQMLNDTLDPGLYREITNQMNEQLDILREKDRLSQYDVDYANAQLEILQKRIALEEAQRNKSQLKLRRNAQGNYSYVYTADQSQVDNAQAELLDAERNAYDISKNARIEAIDNMFANAGQLRTEFLNIINMPEGEERDMALQNLITQYASIFEQLGTVVTSATENALIDADALAASILDLNQSSSFLMLENATTVTQEMLGMMDERWDASVAKWTEGGETIKEAFSTLKDDVVTILDAYSKEVEDKSEAINLDLNDMSSYIDAAADATSNLAVETGNFINLLKSGLETIQGWKDAMSWYDLQRQKEYVEQQAAAAGEQLEDSYGEEANAMLKGNTGAGTTGPGGTAGAGNGEAGENVALEGTANAELTDDGKIVVNGTAYTFADLVEGIAGNIWTWASWGNEPERQRNLIEAFGEEVGTQIYNAVQELFANGYGYQYNPGQWTEGGYDAYLPFAKPASYDTGGYTGDWGTSDGRIAILHQKELILNAHETEDMLKIIDHMREMEQYVEGRYDLIDQLASTDFFEEELRRYRQTVADWQANMKSMSDAARFSTYTSNLSRIIEEMGGSVSDQNVYIEANFPAVQTAMEIQEALLGLANEASHYMWQRDKH